MVLVLDQICHLLEQITPPRTHTGECTKVFNMESRRYGQAFMKGLCEVPDLVITSNND